MKLDLMDYTVDNLKFWCNVYATNSNAGPFDLNHLFIRANSIAKYLADRIQQAHAIKRQP